MVDREEDAAAPSVSSESTSARLEERGRLEGESSSREMRNWSSGSSGGAATTQRRARVNTEKLERLKEEYMRLEKINADLKKEALQARVHRESPSSFSSFRSPRGNAKASSASLSYGARAASFSFGAFSPRGVTPQKRMPSVGKGDNGSPPSSSNASPAISLDTRSPLMGLQSKEADAAIDPLFILHDNDPLKVMRSLLDTMVHGTFDERYNNTIRSPEHLKLLLLCLLPRVPHAAQLSLLEYMGNILERRLRNREACRSIDLICHLLGLVTSGVIANSASESSEASNNRNVVIDESQINNDELVLRCVARVLKLIGAHSLSLRDLQMLFGTFSGSHSVAPSLVLAILEGMVARRSCPQAFFDFDHMNCGIAVPTLSAFPTSGYTFAGWVRFEAWGIGMEQTTISDEYVARLPGQNNDRLFCFAGPRGDGVEAVVLESGRLCLRTFTSSHRNVYEVTTSAALDLNTWTWICVVHSKVSVWRSKASVYVNGEVWMSQSRLRYPSTSEMKPCATAILGGYQGQMSSALFFASAMNRDQISELYALSMRADFAPIRPPATASKKKNRSGDAAAAATVSRLDRQIYEKLAFAFDARNVDFADGVCFDCGPTMAHHGRLIPSTPGRAGATGTPVCVIRTMSIQKVFAVAGGPKILLPLLMPPTLPMLPKTLACYSLGELDVSSVVSLITQIFSTSVDNAIAFRSGIGQVSFPRLLVRLLAFLDGHLISENLWESLLRLYATLRVTGGTAAERQVLSALAPVTPLMWPVSPS